MGEYSRFHGYAYDGVWAAAIALQIVYNTLRKGGSLMKFSEFKYRDPIWEALLKDALNEISFVGVTVRLLSKLETSIVKFEFIPKWICHTPQGHVAFEKNERRGLVLLKQFRGKITC